MAFANSTSVAEKLSALWLNTDVETLETAGRKYVMMSDIHLGDGGPADDLRNNERVLLDVLNFYSGAGYTLVLVGDIEELWQFDLEAIVRRYQGTVYTAIRAFGDRRVHRIFGNHDREWGDLEDPATQPASKVRHAAEAIKLQDTNGNTRFLLVHGHQGSIESDKYAWMSRFFVRLFKLVEPMAKLVGVYGHSSATKSQIPGDYERTMYSWAKAHQAIVICGHTHRAMFASRSHAERLLARITELRSANAAGQASSAVVGENISEIVRLRRQWRDEKKRGRVIEPVERAGEPLPCYFNTGCTLYTDGVTAIEISDGEIRLIKWDRSASGPASRRIYHQDYLDSVVAQVVDQR